MTAVLSHAAVAVLPVESLVDLYWVFVFDRGDKPKMRTRTLTLSRAVVLPEGFTTDYSSVPSSQEVANFIYKRRL